MTKKLLLAEDSLTIQKVFALTFHQSDISLTTVDNGEDAVRLAGEISPDLVVADVTLPDRSGFEVASALRGGGASRSCPILILAGSLPPFDEETFRKCGADAVLFKPFESQELIDKVDQLLRGGEVPVDTPAEETAEEPGEGWDFSDVIEEVEEEAGKPASASIAAAVLLPEDGGPAGLGEEARSLGEFDVSLEELAGEGPGTEPPPSGRAPESFEPDAPQDTEGAPTGMETEAMEEDLPLIDLQAEDLAFPEPEEPAGEIVPPEEFREPEEVPVEEEPVDRGTGPAAEPAPPVEEPVERLPEDILEPAPFVPADPYIAMVTAVPEETFVSEERSAERGEVPEAEPGPASDAFREEFSDRVRGILETVAAETVEKVMWEMMDRLSGEIRRQIREAVEAVAWDVIPATAESLIREEIERIRGKAGE